MLLYDENYEAKEYDVYTIFGYDLKGNKEILGLWLNQTESKKSLDASI